MRLIVDVMNVLHAWRSGPERGKGTDVAALARAIRQSRFSRWEVVLVCDGTPPPGVETVDGGFEAEGCRVLFSGAGIEADEVIEGLLAGDGPVRETVVASADRRLGRAAHRRGARSMGSATFIGVLLEDAKGRPAGKPASPGRGSEGVLGSGEVAAWLEEFGLKEEQQAENREPRPGGNAEGTEGAPSNETPDDWLAEAEREWRISEGDLDMGRWLEEGEK